MKGVSSLSASEQAIDALNIAQKKKMRVNKTYLEFMSQIHNDLNLLTGDIQTPFPTKRYINNKELEFQIFDESLSVNAMQRFINRRAINHFTKFSKKNKKDDDVIFDSLKVANVMRVEMDLNKEKKRRHVELGGLRSKRQLLQTSLTLARIYDGFPIYYGTKLDYRTRMYPWEYLLSRTTGELKHLLVDFSERTLNMKGVVNLMKAYYNFSLEKTIEFNTFLKDNNLPNITGYRLLKQFFLDSLHDSSAYEDGTYDVKDQVCYWLTLECKLHDFFVHGKKKTGLMLEIDQKASGLMILALLFQLKSLAAVTNLTGGHPQDVYLFVVENMASYFETATYTIMEDVEVPFENGKVLELLKNRKLSKGLVMR
jgi:hypothetical protein